MLFFIYLRLLDRENKKLTILNSILNNFQLISTIKKPYNKNNTKINKIYQNINLKFISFKIHNNLKDINQPITNNQIHIIFNHHKQILKIKKFYKNVKTFLIYDFI